ncbi:LRR receptor-like serine threonine-protein kinase [Seminavis robusta]|uniref:LRR receptor-like serine threonine-protein kinase n=1 Tax=Seminavis robusta TaxID=568900 RepID=A0A9N8DDA3_9STRA|nr:LRR receptor-like serine threonine-protein kinase [Seminavis robusta]|eukprot:Sro42_g025710.1 LRR receptor-like serine threonine-protein kinase (707) ;mRNA; r:97338-99553
MATPSPRAARKTRNLSSKSSLAPARVDRPRLQRSHTADSAGGGPTPPARSASMGRSRPMTAEEESELLGTSLNLGDAISGGSSSQKREDLMGGSEIISTSARRWETASAMASGSAIAPGSSSRRRASAVDPETVRRHAKSLLETNWKRTKSTDPPRSGSAHKKAITTMENAADSSSHDNTEPIAEDSFSSLPGLTDLKTVPKALPMGASLRSSVAQRFLDLDDSDSDNGGGAFDLGASMGLAKYTDKLAPLPSNDAARLSQSSQRTSGGGLLETISNSLHSLQNLHMSQMTLTNKGTEDVTSDSEDDLVDFEGEEPDIDEVFENPFAKRHNLRAVDQSVNLMNAEAGQYDWSSRGSRGGKDQQKRNKTMAELFLGEAASSTSRNTEKVGNLPKKKKKPKHKRKKKRSKFSLMCHMICSKTVLIVVGIAVAIFLLVSPVVWNKVAQESTSNDTSTSVAVAEVPEAKEEPSSLDKTDSPFYSADIIQERRQALEDLLSSTNNVDAVTDSAAAQEAMLWITTYDPAQMDIPKETSDDAQLLLQRYAMAVFFFDMHPKVPASTAPHVIITSRTAIKQKDKDDTRRHLARLAFLDWMTASHVCVWEGLTCDAQDSIVSVNLSKSRMRGTLPPELGLLGKSLVNLDLSDNHLSGPVPDKAWSNLKALDSLKLHKNELTGTIGSDFCVLPSLNTFTSDCLLDELECDCCSTCY